MCTNPILIPNKSRVSKKGHIVAPSFHLQHDTSSLYIRVPCGQCAECIKKKQINIMQRSQILEMSYHPFFFTLTYDNIHLRTLSLSSGEEYAYCDWTDITKMLKLIRKYWDLPRKIKYIIVNEYGKQTKRPHYHGIFYVEKLAGDNFGDILNLQAYVTSMLLRYYCRNVGTNRNPIFEPLFTFSQKRVFGKLTKNFDCHYILSSTKDDKSNPTIYILKYMFKESKYIKWLKMHLKETLTHVDDTNEVDLSEYRFAWNLLKPRCVYSKNFGLKYVDKQYKRREVREFNPGTKEFVSKNFDLSKHDPDAKLPQIYNTASGKGFTISSYYRSLLTREQLDFFYSKVREQFGDVFFIQDTTTSELIQREQKNNEIRDKNYSDLLDL